MPELVLPVLDALLFLVVTVVVALSVLVAWRTVAAHEEPHEREARVVAESDARDEIVRRHRASAARLGLVFDQRCDPDLAADLRRGPLADGVEDGGAKWAVRGHLGGRDVRTFFYDDRVPGGGGEGVRRTVWVAAVEVSEESGPLHLRRGDPPDQPGSPTTGDDAFDAVWRVEGAPAAVRRHLAPPVTRMLAEDAADEWWLQGGWLAAYHVFARELEGAPIPDVERVVRLLRDVADHVEVR